MRACRPTRNCAPCATGWAVLSCPHSCADVLLSADVLLNAAGAGEAPRSVLYVGIRDREHGWHRVLVPPVSTQVRAGGFPVKRPCNYPVLAAAWLHLDCHQHGDVYHTPQVLRPAALFSLLLNTTHAWGVLVLPCGGKQVRPLVRGVPHRRGLRCVLSRLEYLGSCRDWGLGISLDPGTAAKG